MVEGGDHISVVTITVLLLLGDGGIVFRGNCLIIFNCIRLKFFENVPDVSGCTCGVYGLHRSVVFLLTISAEVHRPSCRLDFTVAIRSSYRVCSYLLAAKIAKTIFFFLYAFSNKTAAALVVMTVRVV